MKSIHALMITAFSLAALPGNLAAQLHPKQPSQREHPRKPPGPPANPRIPQFGDPLPGLTRTQLQDFNDGKEEFEATETEAGGLGPIFNRASCATCHSAPVTGGSSEIVVTRFGRTTNGVFDPLTALGGSLLQDHAINPAVQELVPPEANTRAQRRSTAVFGLGLVEAIPDEVILRNARMRPLDGVLGKPSFVTDVASGKTRVGRFGWKAQQATLLAFAGDAYLNEMGVTSRLFPTENAPNGNFDLLNQYDLVMDPEDTIDPVTGKGDIDHAADFMRLLGPPPPAPDTRSSTIGRMTFHNIGCALCHLPQMMTGNSPVNALAHRPVLLWSDLLLHDMGSLGDGITQNHAGPREMKTAPLWGLRAQTTFLHDGRAKTLDEAIRAHDGEAKNSRERYVKLNTREMQALLDFLQTL